MYRFVRTILVFFPSTLSNDCVVAAAIYAKGYVEVYLSHSIAFIFAITFHGAFS